MSPEPFRSRSLSSVPELDDLNETLAIENATTTTTAPLDEAIDVGYTQSRLFLSMLTTHRIQLPEHPRRHVQRLTWDDMRTVSVPRKPFTYESSHVHDLCIGCDGPLFPDDAFRRRYGLDLIPSADRKHLFICRICQSLLPAIEQNELLMNMASSNCGIRTARDTAALTGRIEFDGIPDGDGDLVDVPLNSAITSSSMSPSDGSAKLTRVSKPIQWCRALSNVIRRMALEEKEEIEQRRDAQRADATRHDPLLDPPPRRIT